MKDPQRHNHQAWLASPHGRSWQAEAERQGQGHGQKLESATETQRHGENREEGKEQFGMQVSPQKIFLFFFAFSVYLCVSVSLWQM
ncbi:hypothetical protein [Geobacter sp. AOG2]|uniref:hypothetical protein n=1 Tax=Geobacter sp. AOG2 TaxID=1566347 RepID=UPI001CC5C172|nr:hypothetical protein [Geobacter sp. AOG2]GFE62872.1 hypothetical protein AOG2_34610 [Geobacter sp. AOG2]